MVYSYSMFLIFLLIRCFLFLYGLLTYIYKKNVDVGIIHTRSAWTFISKRTNERKYWEQNNFHLCVKIKDFFFFLREDDFQRSLTYIPLWFHFTRRFFHMYSFLVFLLFQLLWIIFRIPFFWLALKKLILRLIIFCEEKKLWEYSYLNW